MDMLSANQRRYSPGSNPEAARPAVAPYLLRAFFKSSGLTVDMREDFAGEMK
jgi:hypothetical protein